MIAFDATLTTNTATAGFTVSGQGTVFATGTFGGGTLKLQVSPDNVNWADAKDNAGAVVTLTAPGPINFDVGNCFLRASLSGATAPNIALAGRGR